MVTDNARLKNVPPPLDLTRILLKSYYKRNDRRKFPEKYKWLIPCEINRATWLVKNGKTLFSKLMQKLSWHEARRQASKWIPPPRQILFILLVNYFNNISCTFHLGKMFIRFLSITFDIYCSLAPHLLCITIRLSGSMFLPLLLAISFSKKWTFEVFYGDQLVYLLVCLVC